MALGRGKYGGIAEELLVRFRARGIILAILDGEHGNGIEVDGPATLHRGVPDFLEAIAKDIRKQANADADEIERQQPPTPPIGASVDRVTALVDRIRPVLAGEDPSNQGAALADLLAIWIAGHAPKLREPTLAFHIDHVRRLIPVNARSLAERSGLENWEG